MADFNKIKIDVNNINSENKGQRLGNQIQNPEDLNVLVDGLLYSDSIAQNALDNSLTATNTANVSLSIANEAKDIALGIDGKAQTALDNSQIALDTIANEVVKIEQFKTDTTTIVDEFKTHTTNRVDELELAIAEGGTVVSVDNVPVPILNFTSDPQEQIDNKLHWINIRKRGFYNYLTLFAVNDSRLFSIETSREFKHGDKLVIEVNNSSAKEAYNVKILFFTLENADSERIYTGEKTTMGWCGSDYFDDRTAIFTFHVRSAQKKLIGARGSIARFATNPNSPLALAGIPDEIYIGNIWYIGNIYEDDQVSLRKENINVVSEQVIPTFDGYEEISEIQYNSLKDSTEYSLLSHLDLQNKYWYFKRKKTNEEKLQLNNEKLRVELKELHDWFRYYDIEVIQYNRCMRLGEIYDNNILELDRKSKINAKRITEIETILKKDVI